MNESNIILYETDDGNINVDVILKDETIWLTQKSIAELFDVNSQAITKHLQNIYNDGELQKEGTCSKMERVQKEGSRSVKRNIEFYNVRLCNQIGIIDSDYYNNVDNEGHIWLKIQNEGNEIFELKKGEAIVQGMFFKYLVTKSDLNENYERRSDY